MLQRRPNTFAQTILSLSFFACDNAADHTFLLRRHSPAERIRTEVNPVQAAESGAGVAVWAFATTMAVAANELIASLTYFDRSIRSIAIWGKKNRTRQKPSPESFLA